MRARSVRGIAFAGMLTSLAACQTSTDYAELPRPAELNLQRFMGQWYVIGNIPTFIEKRAYNAVEEYTLAENGRIDTTFTFNQGGFDGPLKSYHPNAVVYDGSDNTYWGMQFVWPFRAEYRVLYVDADYQYTVVGRSKRDYAWIMARQPQISEQWYERMVNVLRTSGYDVGELRAVPQQPLSER